MKRQNVQRLIAISLSAATLGLAACGNKPQGPSTPSQNNTQTSPPAQGAPGVPKMAAPGQPNPGQPFPGPPMPMPGEQPFPGEPMPVMPTTPVSMTMNFTQDDRNSAVVEIVMTEDSAGNLMSAMAQLDSKRRGSFVIANLDRSVVFSCKTLGVGAQCAVRLVHSAGMMVAPQSGRFLSSGLNLLHFSGADAILKPYESHFSMTISDSTGAYFAIVMSQSRDNRSSPLISIEGQAGSSSN